MKVQVTLTLTQANVVARALQAYADATRTASQAEQKPEDRRRMVTEYEEVRQTCLALDLPDPGQAGRQPSGPGPRMGGTPR
jgi:hypothetical protein